MLSQTTAASRIALKSNARAMCYCYKAEIEFSSVYFSTSSCDSACVCEDLIVGSTAASLPSSKSSVPCGMMRLSGIATTMQIK